MAQDNPFVYGEIVTAGAFADRDHERARLAQAWRGRAGMGGGPIPPAPFA